MQSSSTRTIEIGTASITRDIRWANASLDRLPAGTEHKVTEAPRSQAARMATTISIEIANYIDSGFALVRSRLIIVTYRATL